MAGWLWPSSPTRGRGRPHNVAKVLNGDSSLPGAYTLLFKDEGEVGTAVSEGRLGELTWHAVKEAVLGGAVGQRTRGDVITASSLQLLETCLVGEQKPQLSTCLQCVPAALRQWRPGARQRALCAGRLSDSRCRRGPGRQVPGGKVRMCFVILCCCCCC